MSELSNIEKKMENFLVKNNIDLRGPGRKVLFEALEADEDMSKNPVANFVSSFPTNGSRNKATGLGLPPIL